MPTQVRAPPNNANNYSEWEIPLAHEELAFATAGIFVSFTFLGAFNKIFPAFIIS